jgi:hypothetical protein
MKKIILSTSLFSLALPAFGASFALSGNYRFGTNMLVNTDLSSGTKAGAGNTTSYLEHRFLLQPNVLIDERFSVKSELSFLDSKSGDSKSGGFVTGMGTPLDNTRSVANGSQFMDVTNLYLNWSSDWGLFRFGRMPKTWGLGILYDGGESVFDDFGTVSDRADFQAMLGNLGLRIAFEKGSEGLVSNESDDIDVYELAIDYANAGGDSNVGILYSRNIRLLKVNATNSSHDLSIFAKKSWNKFQLGAEFVSISEENKNAASGFLAQVDYAPGSWRLGYDVAYASASGNSSYSFNPNYKPFMLLFRNSLGPNTPVTETRAGRGVGSDVANNGGAGALVNKGHLSYRFETSQITLGSNLGYAQLAKAGNAASKNLGFETDLFMIHQWYDNFKLQYALGILVPGKAFGSNAKASWGFELKGALEF